MFADLKATFYTRLSSWRSRCLSALNCVLCTLRVRVHATYVTDGYQGGLEGKVSASLPVGADFHPCALRSAPLAAPTRFEQPLLSPLIRLLRPASWQPHVCVKQSVIVFMCVDTLLVFTHSGVRCHSSRRNLNASMGCLYFTGEFLPSSSPSLSSFSPF